MQVQIATQELGEYAWYDGNTGSRGESDYGSKPVGTKTANPLGLKDMSGNVWEWCWDWYVSYETEAQTDPMGPTSGSNRVLRGGNYYFSAVNCRVANRNYIFADFRYRDLGFRVARALQFKLKLFQRGGTGATERKSERKRGRSPRF